MSKKQKKYHHQQPDPTNLPGLDIEHWVYTDGTIGARLKCQPEGVMWARDMNTLVHAVIWINKQVEASVAIGVQSGTKGGTLDLGAQMIEDEGVYCVRFLPISGFGVTFPRPECLGDWITAWITPWLEAANKKTTGAITIPMPEQGPASLN